MGHRIAVAACALIAAVACGSAPHAQTRKVSPQTVRVDGYALTVECAGPVRGTLPTIILLAGVGEPLTTFAHIQDRLSASTRVCSYDRPGEGTSPKPQRKQTLADAAKLLHDLIAALHLAAHGIVLVGHSLGGEIAAEYASSYRGDRQVKALVLLDATPPGFTQAVKRLIPARTTGAVGELRSSDAAIAAGDNPERLVLSAAPMAPLGDVPLTVVRHGRQIFAGVPHYGARLESIWIAGQRRWLRLSTRSRMVVARHSGHAIYLDQPALTLQIIRQALAQASSR